MLLSLRFLPITSLAVASSAFTLPQQASATTESQLIFQDSDYVYMKVCLDTSTSTYVEKTPFQCTNSDGSSTYQLVDPTTSTPIMYFHSNYAPTWENWISYCEKTYGQQREYSFPLSTIGADNKGNNYTLMVHWLSEVSSEYMSGGSDKNCMLNSEVTHTKSATTLSGVDDGYGVLTIYNEPSSMGNSYGTHSYMTLLGENLPANVNTAAASDLLYYDGLPLARAFGITLGNGYTTNNKPPAYSPGIQNFNNGWAHDLVVSRRVV